MKNLRIALLAAIVVLLGFAAVGQAQAIGTITNFSFESSSSCLCGGTFTYALGGAYGSSSKKIS